MKTKPVVDWSLHEGPKNELRCTCGHVWRSHSKFVGAVLKIVPEFDCPVCGHWDLILGASSGRERFTL